MPDRRRRVLALTLATLVVGALAGCQAATIAGPGPSSTSPSASSSASTPTGAPVLRPTEPLDGDCGRLLADATVAAALGEVEMLFPSERDDLGVRTSGGIMCPYSDGGRRSGIVTAVPVEAAGTGTALDEPACATVYGDGWECIAARVVGEFWVLASMAVTDSDESDSATFLAALSDAQDAVGGILEGATFDGVDATAASVPLPIDCVTLGDQIDVADRLDATEVFPTRIEEGNGPIERRVADALALSARCDWSELGEFRELGVSVFPDADWVWAELELGDPEDVEVAGTTAVLSIDRHGAAVLMMTDGTNLIEVRGSGLSRDEVLDAAERVATALT